MADADFQNALAGYATILIMIAGVVGNILTIVALVKCPRLRNVASTFIIGLCFADCLFCAIVLPFNASRFITGTWVHGGFLCKVVPFVQYGNVGLSLLFIAMITINRYIMIAHYHLHGRIYKPTYVAMMIVFCLLLSFGMQLPTLFGLWGEFRYDEKLGTCSIMEDASGNSSKSSLFIIGFVIPCIIIVTCYTRIFWVVRRSENRLMKHSAQNNNKKLQVSGMPVKPYGTVDTRENKRKKNEWKITKMVLAIFLSFLMCYLPITVVKVADDDVKYPSFHVISYLTLYCSACINPIIYVIMNKQYRKAYKKVIFCNPSALFQNSSVPDRIRDENSKTIVSNISMVIIERNQNGSTHL